MVGRTASIQPEDKRRLAFQVQHGIQVLGLGSRYVCFESVATESLGHRTLEAHVAQVGPTLQPPAESSATTILGHPAGDLFAGTANWV